MKQIIILFAVLLISFAGTAQKKHKKNYTQFCTPCISSVQFEDDDGIVAKPIIDTIVVVYDSCCTGSVGDNMFWNLPKSKTKVHSEPLYMSDKFQAYLTNEGHWVRTALGFSKDTIACKPRYSSLEENREYIKYLVTTAYYYGINRNASVRNKGYLKGLKVHQDLKKLLTAVDKSF